MSYPFASPRMTRRKMLQLSAAAAALAACNRIPGTTKIQSGADAPTGATSASKTATLTLNPSTKAVALLAANRLMFGPRMGDVGRIQQMGVDAFIEEQLGMAASADDDNAELQTRLAQLKTLSMNPAELAQMDNDKTMGRGAIIGELQAATILRAVYGKRQLFEVICDFWSNHFNINATKNQVFTLKATDDREVTRKHALGNFRDLLGASAHSPAMLVYLDNQANRKLHPDENYARELLELHTVGVDGGYTQTDVQELSRALTGWDVVMPPDAQKNPALTVGSFFFNAQAHDAGAKTVMGLKLPANGGQRDGDAALDMLAAHPSTAKFICAKLARRFISDTPPASAIQKGVDAFTKSKGDLKATLSALLHSDEFKQSFGQKLKRPFEFGVSALRVMGAQVDATPQLLGAFRGLGQPLFLWSTPDGYPDVERAWTSTNLVLARWNFALTASSNSLQGVRADVAGLAKNAAPAAPVDALAQLMLGDVLPQTAKDALKPFEGQPAALAALMLASPLFQIRG